MSIGIAEMGSPNQNILVTGGAGYIGSVLIPMLMQRGLNVTLLDTFQTVSSDCFGNHIPELKVIQGDIRDLNVVRESLQQQDAVIYLAGVSDGNAGRANPQLTEDVNFKSFRGFVEEAKKAGCRRLAFASTFGVYGYNYSRQLTEELLPDPQEPYSSSKFKAEQILKGMNDESFTTVSLRFAMVYGYSPNMRLNFVLNRLIYDALTNRKINVLGGAQIRPQIHVRDVGTYFCRMLSVPEEKISGEVFNACAFNKTIHELAIEIKTTLGNDISINLTPARENETSFILNQDKLQKATGLMPNVTLGEAIKELESCLTSLNSRLN